MRGLTTATGGYQYAHELAHANDIRRRLADRNVTTGQIVQVRFISAGDTPGHGVGARPLARKEGTDCKTGALL